MTDKPKIKWYIDARMTFRNVLAAYVIKSHEYCIEHKCKNTLDNIDYIIGELLEYFQSENDDGEEVFDDYTSSSYLRNGLYIVFSVDMIINEFEPSIITGDPATVSKRLPTAHQVCYKLTEKGLEPHEHIPTTPM